MPCRYDDYGESDRRKNELLDKLTRLLCYACQTLSFAEIAANAELKEWWDEHQKADREREAREQAERNRMALAAQALSKLTAAERAALNIRK